MNAENPIRVLMLHRRETAEVKPPSWIARVQATMADTNLEHQTIAVAGLLSLGEVSPRTVEATMEPDLIVFLDPGYGTWRHRDYQDVQQQYPLATLVTVTGPWAAGGWRSADQWEGSFHVSHLAWPQQLTTFVQQRAAGKPTIWDGPSTITRARRLSQGNQQESASSHRLGLIGADPEMLEALEASCRLLGHSVERRHLTARHEFNLRHLGDSSPPTASTDVQVWVWDWAAVPQVAEDFSRAMPSWPRPCVILTGYAEVNVDGLLQPLLQAPGIVVLGKPFLLDELEAAIGNLGFQNR